MGASEVLSGPVVGSAWPDAAPISTYTNAYNLDLYTYIQTYIYLIHIFAQWRENVERYSLTLFIYSVLYIRV